MKLNTTLQYKMVFVRGLSITLIKNDGKWKVTKKLPCEFRTMFSCTLKYLYKCFYLKKNCFFDKNVSTLIATFRHRSKSYLNFIQLLMNDLVVFKYI